MNMQNDAFFKKASNAIGDDIDDFDNYIVNQADDIKLNQMPIEQIARLECLVGHIGGEKWCDPSCDKNDSSVCFFMMHLVNDVLSNLGVIASNEKHEDAPIYLNRMCIYKQKFLGDIMQTLEKAMEWALRVWK